MRFSKITLRKFHVEHSNFKNSKRVSRGTFLKPINLDKYVSRGTQSSKYLKVV